MRGGRGHHREHPCREHPHREPTCHPGQPPSLRAYSGSSSIFARDGLKGAFPAGEGERRFGSLLLPCPAHQSRKAFSCRYPLCLGRLQGHTGGTCKVSPVVKPPLVVPRCFFLFWWLDPATLLHRPCPSRERWRWGAGVTPSRAQGCPVSSHFLPNTQGPHWAFKIPFITMEPSRLKSQAGSLGLVSGVAG